MSSTGNQSSQITEAIRRILKESAVAALATLVEAESGVGSKLLVDETGARTGTLHDEALDEAVALYAKNFFNSRAEARTFKVEEIAENLNAWIGARILFERIE